MSRFTHSPDAEEIARVGKLEAEKIVGAVALRYGFRGDDFSIAWDGGNFDAAAAEHELLIVRNDGQQAAARITNEALLRKDPWKYFRDVDGAFAKLARRALTRGL
jgi:hypothetical protein